MLILLDRDGVINLDLPQSVTSVEAFQMLPGAPEAIRRLNQAGHQVAVVTNQACVGRGDVSETTLEAIHKKMRHEMALAGATLDKIYVCIDTEIEPNQRRKPAPGMILEALRDFKACPTQTVMIGDASRDLEAAWRAGCHSILVRTGKGTATYQALSRDQTFRDKQVPVLKDLPEAVQYLLTASSSPLSAKEIG